MRELVKFLARALEGRQIGENRHVVAELSLVVVDAAQILPLRVHLAVLAPVPDLSAPDAIFLQRLPHLPVEGGVMLAGGEELRRLAEHFLGAVTGDPRERRVDVHDVLLRVGDQHAFLGAVENRGGLLQAGFLQMLGALLLIEATDVPATEHEQQGAGERHEQGALAHLPGLAVTAHQLAEQGVAEKYPQHRQAEVAQAQPDERGVHRCSWVRSNTAQSNPIAPWRAGARSSGTGSAAFCCAGHAACWLTASSATIPGGSV